MTSEESGLTPFKKKPTGSDKILKRVTSKVLVNLMRNGFKLGKSGNSSCSPLPIEEGRN